MAHDEDERENELAGNIIWSKFLDVAKGLGFDVLERRDDTKVFTSFPLSSFPRRERKDISVCVLQRGEMRCKVEYWVSSLTRETIRIRRVDTGEEFEDFRGLAASLGLVLSAEDIEDARWTGHLDRLSPERRERAIKERQGYKRIERARAREEALVAAGEDGQPGTPMAVTPENIRPIFTGRQTKAQKDKIKRWLEWGYWRNAIERGETDVTFKTWETNQDAFLEAQARGDVGNKTFDEWVAEREAKRRDGAGGASGGGAGTPKDA